MEVLRAQAFTLACEDEFEDEEEEEAEDLYFQDDSNPSCSQQSQPDGEDYFGDESSGGFGAYGNEALAGSSSEKFEKGMRNSDKNKRARTSYDNSVQGSGLRRGDESGFGDEEEQKEEEEVEEQRKRKEGKRASKMLLHEMNEEEEGKEKDITRTESESREIEIERRMDEMGLEDDARLDFPEMLGEMLNSEKRKPRKCVWNNPQTRRQRAMLVDWISQLCEGSCFALSDRTAHLTVDIIDAINGNFTNETLCLATLSALLIAAKHEEIEEIVPTVRDLNNACEGRYSEQLLVRMELLILTKLNWEVMRLTSVLFLHNFVRQGACKLFLDQDLFDGKELRFEQVDALEVYLCKYASFFCDVCLQDIELSQEQHSVLAAASLACSRKALKLTPEWPETLQKVTTYTPEQLSPVAAKLWTHYSKGFLNNDNNK